MAFRLTMARPIDLCPHRKYRLRQRLADRVEVNKSKLQLSINLQTDANGTRQCTNAENPRAGLEISIDVDGPFENRDDAVHGKLLVRDTDELMEGSRADRCNRTNYGRKY